MMPDTFGWSRAELHVTKELERLAEEVIALRTSVQAVGADVMMLKAGIKAHAAIFGLIGGGVATLVGGIVLAVVLR